jgi:hypothetical protein
VWQEFTIARQLDFDGSSPTFQTRGVSRNPVNVGRVGDADIERIVRAR